MQLRAADVAGVDDMCMLADVTQQFAFTLNDLHQILAAIRAFGLRQRVAAAGFRKAAHQGAGGCIQKHHMQVQARGFEALQLLQLARQVGQAGGAARINRNGHAVAVVHVLQAHKVFQQLGRQVVHAVVAGVFQRMQGHGFAGARHSCNQHNF